MLERITKVVIFNLHKGDKLKNSNLTKRNHLNLIDNGRESNFTDQVWIVYNYDN